MKDFRITMFALLCFAVMGCVLPLHAQEQDSVSMKPTFGLEYTGEFQTNFEKDENFVNLLKLSAEVPLSRSLTFHATTLSAAKSRDERLANDLQTFSNIEIDNLTLALSMAGLGWQINDQHYLFAGIRNMNEDYFASEVTSLFTNSSNGIFPTVACNYPIANYPMASVGVHYKYETEPIKLQASLYNGVGYNRFTGRENVFRFCPKSDGVFAVTEGEYEVGNSHYFLGASFHYGKPNEGDSRQVRPSAWAYAEQAITHNLSLMAAYSHDFQHHSSCRNFFGMGGKLNIRKAELGLFSDYTRIDGVDEWATELTCKYPCSEHLAIQPTFFFIQTGDGHSTVGTLRLLISL